MFKVGARRSLIEQKLYEEAIEEIERERNMQPEVEEYCTEYNTMFQIPGFEVSDEIPLDEEVGNTNISI